MIELFPFQARGLDQGRELYRSGCRSVCFVGPTGMGKTILASAAVLGRVKRGGRVAAFAHRRELVTQMARKLEAQGLDVGWGGRRPNAPVQVTSVQTALSNGEIPDADFVIFDEGHHYVSDEWIRIPRAYLEKRALLMILTATPERDDGRGLGGEGGICDGLVVVAQVRELVELNAREPNQGITPIEVMAPVDPVTKLAQAPVDAYVRNAMGRSCAVFAPNVKSAHVFAEQFNARGIEAAVVHGELATNERDGSLLRFARGELRVIVNVAVLTEGWDAPICDVVMLARKIGAPSLYYQIIGRGRRPFPQGGKTRALLIDLSGNVELHGHPDTELVYSLDGIGMSAVGGTVTRPRFCRVCRAELPRDGEFRLCSHPRKCHDEAHCPECGERLSRITVPTPEEVELERVTRDAARKGTADDTRAKALVTLYVKGLRAGQQRGSAHYAYRGLFGGFPPADVRVPAWREAIETVAKEKGDAWIPEDNEKRRAG